MTTQLQVEKSINNLLFTYERLAQNKMDDDETISVSFYLLNLINKAKKSSTYKYVEIDRDELKETIKLLMNITDQKEQRIGIDCFFGIAHSYMFLIDLVMINHGIDYIKSEDEEWSNFTMIMRSKIENRLNSLRNSRGLKNIEYY